MFGFCWHKFKIEKIQRCKGMCWGYGSGIYANRYTKICEKCGYKKYFSDNIIVSRKDLKNDYLWGD